MGDRRHGQEGALAPYGNVVNCFCVISSYSITLSIPIIYALFSQAVVGFWGQRRPEPPPHRSSITGPARVLSSLGP